MTRFVSGATTLQFNQDPVRPYRRGMQLHQVRGKDSDGADYIYTKSTLKRATFRISFPGLTDTVLASLRSFVETTVDGVRNSFVWYDYADTARTVRLAKPRIEHTNTGPDRNRVEIELIEDTNA